MTRFSYITWNKELNQILSQHVHQLELTNGDFARKMHLSERIFYRRVNETTGLTPNHYIRAFRMQKAKQLLLSDKYYQIGEVAGMVRFAKTAYFSRLFEKTFGLRPKELVK